MSYCSLQALIDTCGSADALAGEGGVAVLGIDLLSACLSACLRCSLEAHHC